MLERSARQRVGVSAIPAATHGGAARWLLGLSAATLAAILLVSQHHSASAQSSDEARRRLEESERRLADSRKAEQGLSADVGRLQADREKLNCQLIDMAQLIQQGEGRLTTIEGRLGGLEVQERFLRGSLTERHGSILRLLSAMQRMGRNPPPVMITRREDALLMVRSAMMLAAAFPQIRDQATRLAGELADLGRIIGETRTEGEKLRAETQRLAEQRVRLTGLLEEKRTSLADRQQSLDNIRREAAEITRSVGDLNELITRLDKVVTQQAIATEQAAAQQAAAEQAAKQKAANQQVAAAQPSVEAVVADAAPVPNAAQPPPLRPGDVGVPAVINPSTGSGEQQVALAAPPPPTVEPPNAVTLAPANRKLASLDAGRIRPAIPFAKAKGRLPLPANGKRIIAFGDKAQTSKSNGIVLETRPGAQVTAPSDGWIVFAGVFRSYGQILIINAGDGYHILLAGLSQIDVQLGQFVLAGEPVGLMSGASRDAKAKPPASAPVLYIEFRKDGRSIDPAPWWVHGS